MREEVGWKDGPKILNDTFKYIFYILGSKSKLMKTTTTWIRLNLWFSAKYWDKTKRFWHFQLLSWSIGRFTWAIFRDRTPMFVVMPFGKYNFVKEWIPMKKISKLRSLLSVCTYKVHKHTINTTQKHLLILFMEPSYTWHEK